MASEDQEHPRSTDQHRRRDRSRDKEKEKERDRSHRHLHRRHHHRSRSRSRDRHHHHKKRSRRDDDTDEDRRRRKSRKDDDRRKKDDSRRDSEEKRQRDDDAPPSNSKRDEWMMAPSADFIDYTQKGVRKPSPKLTAKPDYRPIIHKNELNAQLVAGKSLDEYADDTNATGVQYTFGDSGSNWRMTRLKRLYEAANEKGVTVEELALERYGDLRLFDDAREEEIELERREVYGVDRKDAKDRPTGELYAERMRKQKEVESRREEARAREAPPPMQSAVGTKALDQTALNRMQAALMKAQLRGDPKAAKMEEEYNAAMEASRQGARNDNVVVLSAMDNRQLAGLEGRVGREVLQGKKGRLVENENMTIDDMLREEKITRGQGAGRQMAERISRDAKFDDNLDYLDENAAKLAKRVQRNEIDIKNMAINEFKKVQRVLDTCPLCEQDDKPPLAPVISLGTRVFLTLPTEPEIGSGGAIIVPIQHRTNMLECDDDEWEEVRNFMKSLTRMYASQNLNVIFYENAASPQRRKHAAIHAVPLPQDLGEVAPAYFKEAILSADETWSQHKPLIDTLKSPHGKNAFRRSLVKEMPYFHVWFTIDGGMGHIVEDENRWPKGDLFARELLGVCWNVSRMLSRNRDGGEGEGSQGGGV
ncbi:CwfJ C-terminus 1-domain-containing protein-like protein [Trichophaea hybrida]|nr:CwfJ C-terminus 1-domain-containing protein-like protein [Trichophaea hybrida]